MPKKPTYKKIEEAWQPPLSIESINDGTTRSYVRTILPNTHDTKTWYVYVYSKVPMVTMGNGKKKRSSAYKKEGRLLKDDILNMNPKYFKFTWS